MPKYFKNVAITLVTFVVLLANGAAWGQNPIPATVPIYYTCDNQWRYSFPLSCQVYDGNVEAASANPGSTWTADPNFVTSKHAPNATPPVYRFLSHIKPGTLVHPPSSYLYSVGTPPNDTLYYIDNVISAVAQYWNDDPYSSYSWVSGPDPSMNCHGYSTGKNVWLNDFQKLVDDDYSHTKNPLLLWSGVIVGAQDSDNDHSIRLEVDTSNSPLSFKVVSVNEKCRDSGVYKLIINKTFWYGDNVVLNHSDVPTLNGALTGFYLEN